MQTKEALNQLSPSSVDSLSRPIVKEPLSTEQWAELEKINDALTQDYTVRRRMLLKRADVTVQSFTWSGKMNVSVLLSGGMSCDPHSRQQSSVTAWG